MKLGTPNFGIRRLVMGNCREVIIVKYCIDFGIIQMKGFINAPTSISENHDIWVVVLLLLQGGLRPSISVHGRKFGGKF